MLVFSAALLSFVVTVVSNRLIGNQDILPWIPLRRISIYALNGLFMSLLAYVVGGYSISGIITVGAISGLGYALFRQPSPDIAFGAGHGRQVYITPDPKWILWCLNKFHGIHRTVFTARSRNPPSVVIGASVIAGAYRGLLMLPLAIAMSILLGSTALLGLLGSLFGVAYWFAGVKGPWKTEVGMVMRAELIMGGLIVWPNMALPIILGGL